MQVNIQEFIEQAGLAEPFYPGKRVVKPCPQPGEYKSHCVVYDWHDKNKIRVEIKAGLTGRDLPHKELCRYPVSFQSSSFIEIDVASSTMRVVDHTANDDEEEESEGSKGKSGSGGKRMGKHKNLEEREGLSLSSFSSAAEGKVAEHGVITRMVIMGMEIAKEAYGTVSQKLFDQVQHAKISATDLVAAAGKMITRFTPPAFLKPKGDETQVYKYDRMKNEAMFTGMVPT